MNCLLEKTACIHCLESVNKSYVHKSPLLYLQSSKRDIICQGKPGHKQYHQSSYKMSFSLSRHATVRRGGQSVDFILVPVCSSHDTFTLMITLQSQFCVSFSSKTHKYETHFETPCRSFDSTWWIFAEMSRILK